ncbi:hypothetical protein, partial [Bordetella pseudohinzii]|uniref:hypothetical protein n=1 Tax=Bordetella pseudohinzii TaxID=1331258 RepID=UPI001F28005F
APFPRFGYLVIFLRISPFFCLKRHMGQHMGQHFCGCQRTLANVDEQGNLDKALRISWLFVR